MSYENPAWAIGLASCLTIVLLMGVLAAIGARRAGRFGRAGTVAALAFGVYALVFVGLMLSYRRYAFAGGSELVLGLPAPTLWLLVGIWQLPWLLVLVLVWKYDEWTLDAQALDRFKALVHERALENDEPSAANSVAGTTSA